MKTLPLELTQELNKEVAALVHLIELQLTTTYYLTDADMDIYYDNGSGVHQYLSRGIEFDTAAYSLTPKVDSISFSIDNTSLEFSALVMNQETRGKKCVIYRAALDSNLTILGASPLFVGFLDRVEIDQNKAQFDVMNHFLRWNLPTPRRKHSIRCPWTFKGTECGYTSTATVCDKSWDNCTTHARTQSFGGFRWLESLQGKKINWGQPSA